LNGGLMVDDANNMQGDLDIDVYVDGKSAIVGIEGRWQGNPPGIMVDPPNLMEIGSNYGRWAQIWLTTVPCTSAVPGRPRGCFRANGGIVPIY
jgi:hypothetical protein